jgi:hypothetical protein
MAGLRSFGKRGLTERHYRVIIEVSYAGGLLADDWRQMLTTEISIPGARAEHDVAVAVSAERVSILVVSATVGAANPRAGLAQVDDALDRALMATGLCEEFDVTGEVLRVAPLRQAEQCRPESGGCRRQVTAAKCPACSRSALISLADVKARGAWVVCDYD